MCSHPSCDGIGSLRQDYPDVVVVDAQGSRDEGIEEF